jgi:cell division protein FtsI (penicillin-binding protein 3)
VRYAASATVVRLPIWRARFVLFAFVAGFVVLLGRSAWLQSVRTGFLQQRGEARYARVLEVPATRGRILDRRGEALAVSTPVKSIWAIPEDLKATPAQWRRLATLLEMRPGELERRAAAAARDFVYLKRQIPPDTAERVAALGIPGVYEQREYRRYYPGGATTAQLVGFTGVDGKGQEGVELAYQSSLAGIPGSRRVIKDRLGHIVEDIEAIRTAQDGTDLRLALDSKIQSLAFTALKAAVEAHRAKAGALVALDVNSGEVLALVNVPSYNPNNRARLTGAQLRNRVITDVFEPGSTLKPFTVALALELGRVRPDTVIQTGPGALTIDGRTIHDAHPGGALTVAQVIQKSSNVGAAKIALQLPREAMAALFHRLGFGAPPQLGFPGAAAGRVREARTWRPIEQATMAYGHGISVSLMQLAHAYTVFARDGSMPTLSLLRSDAPAAARPVFHAQPVRAMRAMLEAVTQPGGTAPRARVMGWRVAGKTGTARKAENGGYAAHKYIASFVGFAPASAPRLVVAVMIDEPTVGEYYGGAVAAPVFAEVMQGALRLMDVPHDAPLVPIALPGEGEVAEESN